MRVFADSGESHTFFTYILNSAACDLRWISWLLTNIQTCGTGERTCPCSCWWRDVWTNEAYRAIEREIYTETINKVLKQIKLLLEEVENQVRNMRRFLCHFLDEKLIYLFRHWKIRALTCNKKWYTVCMSQPESCTLRSSLHNYTCSSYFLHLW